MSSLHKIPRLIPILIFVAALSSCASIDPKAKEYGELKNLINENHDRALFKDEKNYLVDEMSKPEFTHEFGLKYCGFDTDNPGRMPASTKECDDLYKRALVNGFAHRYFATDRPAIEVKCKSEPLACQDPKILEFWIRTSHNQGIEKSRREKLERLEAWRSGKLTDGELQDGLHMDVPTGG